MGILILIGVLAITVILGRYAIAEGQRTESRKKFDRNLRNFDSKKRTLNELRQVKTYGYEKPSPSKRR